MKKPEFWCKYNWLLHHNNASAHTSLKTTKLVTNNNMAIIPHPSYLLGLAPCDFALFPKLKLKGRSFQTVSDIQRDSQAVLDRIMKTTSTVLLKSGKMMGSLYTFPRRLF
jgi:hypothetical protein